MKPPSSSSKVTKEWIQYIIEEHLKRTNESSFTPDVTIKEFIVKPGANAGEGFNSELVTLDIIASHRKNGAEMATSDTEYHLIVKFFSTDIFSREINKRFNSHLREHAIYAEIIRDLNKFQADEAGNEYHIHIPELIYGKASEKEFILVMENLKVQGYNTNDKYKGLDFERLKEAIIQIARLHAVSYAYNKSHNILTKYPFFKVSEETVKILESFFTVCMDNGIALLKTKEETKDLGKKVDDCKDRLIAKLLKLMIPNESTPNCIIHGDCWNSNLMFKNEDETTSEHEGETQFLCKLIDWGQSTWGSPLFDLHFLIYTSTTLETRKEHLESILQLYHSTFENITSTLKVSVPNWSYNYFKTEWQRLFTYGLLMGMGLSQGTLCKSNPINKPKEPSILDRSVCLPTKVLVDGFKLGMVKTMVPLLFKSSATKLVSALYKKMFQPVRDEILSGTNEVMNTRIMDIMNEADEIGIFDE